MFSLRLCACDSLERKGHRKPKNNLPARRGVSLSNILLIYNINTVLNRQVTRIKKVSGRGFLVDPIPNSPNLHHRNCMTDSKEKYQ